MPPASRLRAKENGTRVSMVALNAAFGVRSILVSLRKHRRYAPSKSRAAASVTRRCYLICLIRSRWSKRLAVSPVMVLMIRGNATTQSQPAMPMLSFHHARMRSYGSLAHLEPGTKRSSSILKIPRAHIVGATDWIPPPKPLRNKDALFEIAWPTPLCARL